MAKFVDAPFSTEPTPKFDVVTAIEGFGALEFAILGVCAVALLPLIVALFRGLFGRSEPPGGALHLSGQGQFGYRESDRK